MAGARNIYTKLLHDAVSITGTGTAMSEMVDLTTKAQNGIFSVHVIIPTASTTSTSVTINAWLSNDGENFVDEDNGGLSIVAALDPSSSNYYKILSFEPKLSKFMKIEIVNANNNVVGATITLAVQ